MIPTSPFGRTGHNSGRVIFGGWALNRATRAEARGVLEVLLESGVNHIDTAPMYGDAEERIGEWMENHRSRFFLATKTRARTREGALNDLERSLSRLRVDSIDLWQMHGLTNHAGWEKAMGPGGALEAFVEARGRGLVKFLGVTGHGDAVAEMHRRSLERFDFDSVMLPYNYRQMKNPQYSADFFGLLEVCRGREIAVQTIQSIARRPWGGRPMTYNTYFYEPLSTQDAIEKSVHWALGLTESFVVSAGDVRLLPKMLEAAARFERPPVDAEMEALVEKYDIRPVFTQAPRREGRHTWGGIASHQLGNLVREGFFDNPRERTLAQVIKAFEARGIETSGKKGNIADLLAGRVRKGILRKKKGEDGWVYWRE